MLKPIEKNWDNFKRFFSKANRDLRESQALSETQVTTIGYQANSVNQELDQALDHEASALESIDNLVVVSSEDKQIISTLTVTNSSLAKELITLACKLQCARKKRTRSRL